jgi:K+-sensing histidine kinase KdpD
MLGIASVQISDLTSMLDDVADLGKFEQGKVMHIHPEVFSLEKLGKRILQEVSPAKPNVEVVLELGPRTEGSFVTLTPGPELAMTDSAVLRRALKQLLANAVDITERGEVRLKIGYNRQGRLTFFVEDTGSGLLMSPDAEDGDLPAIFQLYHQEILPNDTGDLDEAMSRRETIEAQIVSLKKVGLENGLSLSYHLVHSLGGELSYSSTIGEGNRFWFSLPRQVTWNTTIPGNYPLPSTTIRKDTSPPTKPEETSYACYVWSSDENTMNEDEKSSRQKRNRANVFEVPEDVVPSVDMSTRAECGIKKSQVPPSN